MFSFFDIRLVLILLAFCLHSVAHSFINPFSQPGIINLALYIKTHRGQQSWQVFCLLTAPADLRQKY